MIFILSSLKLMRLLRYLMFVDRLCKYLIDMFEIENFNVYMKCLWLGIKKNILVCFFCLNYRIKIKMWNSGFFVFIIFGIDIDK